MFTCDRTRQCQIMIKTAVAAIATLVAMTPFLIHLAAHPTKLTLRFNQTSALTAQNQPRLTYLHPPVGTREVLALQIERALSMFDRYPDGQSFLQTRTPA